MAHIERGFTLVEVLVALALVSGVMLMLLRERQLCYEQALDADTRLTALLLASGLMQETACDNIKEQRFETDRFDQRPEFAWERRSIPCSVEGSGKMLKVVVRVWKGDPSVPPDDDADSVILERLLTP